MRVGIIGRGRIGSALKLALEDQNEEICFCVGTDYTPQLVEDHRPDAVAICISTRDDGEAEAHMIGTALMYCPVVTCAKGALSSDYIDSVVRPRMLGATASVGGATRPVEFLRSRIAPHKQLDVTAVLNGTMNFFLDEVHHRTNVSEITRRAVQNGYAEPGANDPYTLFQGELQDVLRKTCVLYNLLEDFPEDYLTPAKFDTFPFTEEMFGRVTNPGLLYRFFVRLKNDGEITARPEDIPVFRVRAENGWHITGKFQFINFKIDDLDFINWLPSGVDNGMYCVEGLDGAGGTFKMAGPGAGVGPTVQAIMDDLYRLTAPKPESTY